MATDYSDNGIISLNSIQERGCTSVFFCPCAGIVLVLADTPSIESYQMSKIAMLSTVHSIWNKPSLQKLKRKIRIICIYIK
jgi:hypothetical protein